MSLKGVSGGIQKKAFSLNRMLTHLPTNRPICKLGHHYAVDYWVLDHGVTLQWAQKESALCLLWSCSSPLDKNASKWLHCALDASRPQFMRKACAKLNRLDPFFDYSDVAATSSQGTSQLQCINFKGFAMTFGSSQKLESSVLLQLLSMPTAPLHLNESGEAKRRKTCRHVLRWPTMVALLKDEVPLRALMSTNLRRKQSGPAFEPTVSVGWRLG